MKPLLFLVQPIDPATNLRVDVKVGSVPSPVYAGMGGFTWEGAVSRRPRFMQDLMSPKLDGKILTGRGDFMLNLGHVINLAVDPRSLNWSGAPVTVWDATALDYVNMPVEFSGIVANAQLDIWTGQIILNLEVDVGRLDRPLLTGEFIGGGGLLGDADKRGVLWPAGFGYNENCEPVWFDLVNNVGMLDGFSNLTTVHGLFEGGDDRGASFGDYASYALLCAAAIPPGRWATCLTAGLVRLGAPPVGRISCDCTFRGAAGTGANKTGALIRRILETHAGIATGSIDTVTLAAIDVGLPYLVHYWTKEQRGVKDLVEALAAAINGQCLVLLNGVISVTRAFGGTNVGTVNRTSTSAPAVTDWQLAQQEEPVWRMRARTGRPGTVFSFDEILYADNLIDMGAFNIATVYRQGNLVWMPNGSQFLYINLTPSSGHTPPSPATSDAWWQRTKAPTTAADLVYGDGSTIESLKPGMAGATRNIIYRQGTDPVLAVTVYDGDIWTDTSAGIDVTKVRQGGVWQISGTPNFITYSAVAPTSPVNGAIWVDTSVTPNAVRVRVGAAWQIASNLVTQGTDIGVSNGAGTTVTVIPVAANVEAIGNQIRRLSGGSDWTAGWNVADSIAQGCFAQWIHSVAGSAYMVGLTDVPITNAANNYNQIDYGAYVNGTSLDVYINGSGQGLGATVAVGDVLSIAYDNISIRLYRTTAGTTTLIHTFATTAGRRFMACGSMWSAGSAGNYPVKSLRFETYSNQNWADMTGTGRPADNAGTTLVTTAQTSGSGAVAIIGNSATKTGAASAWDSAVLSQPLPNTAMVSARLATGGMAICLEQNPVGNATTYGQLFSGPTADGGMLYWNGANWQWNADGVVLGTTATSVPTLIYDGTTIKAYLDNTLVKTVSATAGRTYYGKLLFYGPTWSAKDFMVAPYSDNAWINTGGAGRPADNATADLALVGLGGGTYTITGNSLTKTAANATYDCAASGPLMTKAFSAEVDIQPNANFTIVGFDTSASNFNGGGATEAFAADYQFSTGNFYITIAGSLVSGYPISIGAGKTGKVVVSYDGVRFRAFVGGTQYGGDFATTAGQSLYARWYIYNTGTYTGLVCGQFSGTNLWGDQGGAHVPAPDAGSTLTFTAIGTQAAEIVVIGNSVTRPVTAGGAAWNAGAASNQRFPGSIQASARALSASSGESVFGIDPTPTGTNYLDPDYSFLISSGTLYSQNNIAAVTTNHGAYAVGDVFTITYDGLLVRWWKNGTLLRTDTAAAANVTYQVQVNIAYAGHGVTDVMASPYTQNNFDVIGGPTRPADNATADIAFATGSYSTGTHTFQGNNITKATGGSGWNAFVASKQSFAFNASTTFLIPNSPSMAGLTSTPQGYASGATTQYFAMNYAVYSTTVPSCQIYESSNLILDMGASYNGVTFTANTLWRIDYDGVNVRYYADGVLMRTSAAAANQTLYFAATIFTNSSQVKSITFSSFTDRYMDNIGDGATYGRTRLTELTGGLLRLTQAGGGRRLGDSRNVPNILGNNLGFKDTGTVSYTAAAGTPATATISITASNVVSGSVTTAYNAMSVNVSGTGGTTVSYYLYVNDPTNAGGAQTLVATTTALTVYQGDGYVYRGYVDVFYPTSGTGGGGGGGGGGWCVWHLAWVETDRGPILANDIQAGDRVRVLTDDRLGFTFEPVEKIEFGNEDCSTITTSNGFKVTVSNSTPITLRDGRLISVAEIPGNELPVDDLGLYWFGASIKPAGVRRVAKIAVNQKTYGAGDIKGQPIYTHNPKP